MIVCSFATSNKQQPLNTYKGSLNLIVEIKIPIVRKNKVEVKPYGMDGTMEQLVLRIIARTETSPQVPCERVRSSSRYFQKVILFSKSDPFTTSKFYFVIHFS
jgi:hypothetical protein